MEDKVLEEELGKNQESNTKICKTSKESSDKDEGSTNEAFKRKKKGTNRQGERKYNNYSQNETKVTEQQKPKA